MTSAFPGAMLLRITSTPLRIPVPRAMAYGGCGPDEVGNELMAAQATKGVRQLRYRLEMCEP